MNKSVLALCAILSMAACESMADESRMSWLPHPTDPTPESFVEIGKTDDPSAVAQVDFYNTRVHGTDSDFSINWNGISVKIFMEWNCNGADECITVIPEAGYIAVPMEINVPEGHTQTVIIREYMGF